MSRKVVVSEALGPERLLQRRDPHARCSACRKELRVTRWVGKDGPFCVECGSIQTEINVIKHESSPPTSIGSEDGSEEGKAGSQELEEEKRSAGGLKYDDGKLPLDLLPLRALQEVAKVLAFGAAKYRKDSWRGVKPRRRYFAALMRHLFDRTLGKRIDEESGLPTMAHAACDALFLLAFDVGFDPLDAFDEDDQPTNERRKAP